MDEGQVYEYLKTNTYKKVDDKDQQVKLTANDLINNLSINEQTIHANLRRIKNWPDVKFETYKIRRIKNGKQFIFNEKKWWIDEEKENNKP